MAASLRHRTWSQLQTQTHTGTRTRTRTRTPLPLLLLLVLFLHSSLVAVGAEETRECSDYEYKDRLGNCLPCTWCGAGQELSKECGFGYGEDARCVACRPQRFKEKFGLYKCKPCLDCSLLNRPQTASCNATNNAVCGDCLPGYYRKTSLGGFLDMECIPCGDPPPPYESQCNTPVRPVNLVPIPSTVTSPRDMALAAVICSALATVLLALMVLCGIYCKRQLLEKKPNGSLRCQEVAFCEAELACLDRRRALEMAQRPCCHCHHGQHGPAHTCGPVQLIPSLCCEDTCSLGRSGHSSPFQSRDSLHDRHSGPSMGNSLGDVFGHPDPGLGEPPEVCPLPLSLSVGAPKPFFTCLCTLRPPPDALIASAEHEDEERDEEQREEEEEEDEQEVEEEEEKEEEMRSSPELCVQEEEEALAERAPLTQQ